MGPELGSHAHSALPHLHAFAHDVPERPSQRPSRERDGLCKGYHDVSVRLGGFDVSTPEQTRSGLPKARLGCFSSPDRCWPRPSRRPRSNLRSKPASQPRGENTGDRPGRLSAPPVSSFVRPRRETRRFTLIDTFFGQAGRYPPRLGPGGGDSPVA